MPSRGKNQAKPSNDLEVGKLGRLPREALLLLCTGIALFLIVSLVSFNPGDPGWWSTGSGAPVHNLAGTAGAWLADALLGAFGYVALLLPWSILWVGLRIYRGAPEEELVSGAVLAVRIGAWLAALLSLAGLCALFFVPTHWVTQGAGGAAGHAIRQVLEANLNAVGATVLLLTVFIAATPLALIFSWMKVLEQLGALALKASRVVVAGLKRISETASEQSSERSAPAVDEVETRASRRREKKRRKKHARKAPDPGVSKGEDQLDLPGLGAVEPLELPTSKARRKSRRKSSKAEVPAFDGNPLPPLDLLDPPRPSGKRYSADELDRMSRELERHLADFHVKAEVVDALPGPVITRFELQLAPGVKGGQVSNLATDLARAMAVASVRVIEVIKGKSVIGLEIPNHQREMVMLSETLSAQSYSHAKSKLALGLGKDISGRPVTADLGRMPHLLVAGATGAGKSVAINAMILSLLYKLTPEQLRIILIDPKMLELSVYDDIPHLLTPVVTDMKDAANALRWCVAEMERRYRLMSTLGVRNLAGLNHKITQAEAAGEPINDPLTPPDDLFADSEAPEPPTLSSLPHVVVVIDELADMMMVVGKKVEELIARIAQKARAAGIHLIVATQRPSVDVITGLIKANIPTRIAFQVASRIDSRTILDQNGAETLLGQGDMLYRPIGASQVERIHGAFVDDHEVHKVVAYLKQTGEPDYIEDVTAGEPEPSRAEAVDAEQDPLYDQAVAIVLESRKASISWVQRRLSVGYNRAARMVEQMEAAGVVGPSGPGGSREILVPGGQD